MPPGLTVRYPFDFRPAADERRAQAISAARKRAWREVKAKPLEGPSRTAVLLAAAHFIERGFADGSIGSFAEAADILGVSRSRASQVLMLLNLSAKVQEGVLSGEDHRSEVALRAVAARGDGCRQRPGSRTASRPVASPGLREPSQSHHATCDD